MFFGLSEDAMRTKVADHERFVARLLLEREAKAAVRDERDRYTQTHLRRPPWNVGWRLWRVAH